MANHIIILVTPRDVSLSELFSSLEEQMGAQSTQFTIAGMDQTKSSHTEEVENILAYDSNLIVVANLNREGIGINYQANFSFSSNSNTRDTFTTSILFGYHGQFKSAICGITNYCCKMHCCLQEVHYI